jgi:hypothetical protein
MRDDDLLAKISLIITVLLLAAWATFLIWLWWP